MTPTQLRLSVGERLNLTCMAHTELNVGIEFNWTHSGQALVGLPLCVLVFPKRFASYQTVTDVSLMLDLSERFEADPHHTTQEEAVGLSGAF